MKFCEKCGTELIGGKCPKCARRKKLYKIISWITGILVIIGVIAYIPYHNKQVHDNKLMKDFTSLYKGQGKETHFINETSTDKLGVLGDEQKFDFKLKKNSDKAKKILKDVSEKKSAQYSFEVLYSDGYAIKNGKYNNEAELDSYATNKDIKKAFEANKKVSDEVFRNHMHELIDFAKSDIKLYGKLEDKIGDLLSDDNLEDDSVDDKADSIKDDIKKINNKSMKKTLSSDLQSQLDDKDDAMDEYTEEQEPDISSLDDVWSSGNLDDLSSYNSKFTPANLALYAYANAYTFDGSRITNQSSMDEDEATGTISDEDDDIKAYWKLDSYGMVTFYNDSDLTDEKKTYDLSSESESDIQDYIDTIS